MGGTGHLNEKKSICIESVCIHMVFLSGKTSAGRAVGSQRFLSALYQKYCEGVLFLWQRYLDNVSLPHCVVDLHCPFSCHNSLFSIGLFFSHYEQQLVMCGPVRACRRSGKMEQMVALLTTQLNKMLVQCVQWFSVLASCFHKRASPSWLL